MQTQAVRIESIKMNGLRYFQLYVFGTYCGLYVTRDEARAAAARYDGFGRAA